MHSENAPGQVTEMRKYTISEGVRLINMLEDGFTDEECGTALNVAPELVAFWIRRFQLELHRKRKLDTEDALELKRRAEERRERWRAKVSAESAALSVDGFQLARDSVTLNDPRGFKDAASGVAQFVNLVRQAEGLDRDTGPKGGSTLNVFIARIGENVRDAAPINVTPAVDDLSFE